jgi:hypothetical protein
LPENRNAEKAVAKTRRAAKRPQIPASGAKKRPRGTQPEISENGGQNSPPDEKLPEIRNAEKAIPKTGRAAKRPQIPAFRAENGPPDTQPENPEGGDHNSNPRRLALPATGHYSNHMNRSDHVISITRRLPALRA